MEGYALNIDILYENIDQAIDSALQKLKNDLYYIKHKKLFDKDMKNDDLDMLLTVQMTLHNIELEAVYHAGHCDCLQYLVHVNAIKSEQ